MKYYDDYEDDSPQFWNRDIVQGCLTRKLPGGGRIEAYSSRYVKDDSGRSVRLGACEVTYNSAGREVDFKSIR